MSLTPSSARRVRVAALVGGAAVSLVALSACNDNTTASSTTTKPSSSVSSKTTSPGSSPSADGGEYSIADPAAEALCTQVQSQVQSWNTYTSTLNRISLNTMVFAQWAPSNGVNPLDVLGHRSAIDTALKAHCGDTYSQAIRALDSPDVGSLLVGMG